MNALFFAGFLFIVLPADTQNIFNGLLNKTHSEFEGLYAIVPKKEIKERKR